MSLDRPRLLFVSPVFLFPAVTGGRIRTTNVLRGMKGGRFRVTLMMPATAAELERWHGELTAVSDEVIAWKPAPLRPRWARVQDLLDTLPVNVVADRTRDGLAAVQRACNDPQVDLTVFDFVHAAVLMPPALRPPSVCFTHNVEAEIFARHAQQARGRWQRWMWRSQHRKMVRFERDALSRFSRVIAVSERDARHFRTDYGMERVDPIPTGVDLGFFGWQAPSAPAPGARPTVVFTGSMDWDANVGGIEWFLREVWPVVLDRVPGARFVVVGRNPPGWLKKLGRPDVEVTGFVDDVRPHVHAAQACVIPLLVGGGTRIKAFEAMAMGCPIVATSLGMEGLDAEPGQHFLQADAPSDMAAALVGLLQDPGACQALSVAARALVEARFGHREVAQVFEDICWRAMQGTDA